MLMLRFLSPFRHSVIIAVIFHFLLSPYDADAAIDALLFASLPLLLAYFLSIFRCRHAIRLVSCCWFSRHAALMPPII